jgi:hypothetical protein
MAEWEECVATVGMRSFAQELQSGARGCERVFEKWETSWKRLETRERGRYLYESEQYGGPAPLTRVSPRSGETGSGTVCKVAPLRLERHLGAVAQVLTQFG